MRKAFAKSFFLLFKEQLGRFCALLAISAVGIGFMSGVGPVRDDLRDSTSQAIIDNKDPDLTFLSSQAELMSVGFSSDEVKSIKSSDLVETVSTFFFNEYLDGDAYTRLYYRGFDDTELEHLNLLEGSYPSAADEVAVERSASSLESHAVGDEISIKTETIFGQMETKYKVVGIVSNQMLAYSGSMPSYHLDENDDPIDLNNVYYLNYEKNTLLNLFSFVNGISLTLKTEKRIDVYSSSYQEEVDSAKTELLKLLPEKTTSALSLKENAGVKALEEYSGKVMSLAIVFSIFFITVVCLVIGSTLARLIEEERSAIGCYRSLGVSNISIALKYGAFASLSVILGAILGYAVIGLLLTKALYGAFSISFLVPSSMTTRSFPLFGFLSTIITVFVALLVTALVLSSSLKESPASLLKPKAPKAGKKVLLERIGFIWKHLSFRKKSSIRNIFLHPWRFFLTLLSVSGSIAILTAGFGLLDSTGHYSQGMDMIKAIAFIVIVAGVLLAFIVIYNLTNISISEKKREIATLMVLGYKDNEVVVYVYREIVIVAFLGILVGLPLGLGFADVVFSYVGFGSVSYIKWYSWFLVAGLEILAIVMADLLLKRKIVKTDMNGSLKAIE